MGAGATILMTLEVPDAIVRKVTGHWSRELERYQHLTPELRALTVNLIATELFWGEADEEGNWHTYRHRCAAGVRQTILGIANMLETGEMLAGSTGLEPAASGVTGSVPHEPSHCAHATCIVEEKLRWQASRQSLCALLIPVSPSLATSWCFWRY